MHIRRTNSDAARHIVTIYVTFPGSTTVEISTPAPGSALAHGKYAGAAGVSTL